MNGKLYGFLYLAAARILTPTCLSQDVSEPISIREFLESSTRNGLAEHVKRIGGLDAFDLMLVLQGEFANRSESFGIKLMEVRRSDGATVSNEAAKFTYAPHDYTRKRLGKNIRFIGQISGKKISDLIQLAKNITENQKFGIQSENQDNSTSGGAVEVYYLFQSSMINPRSDSVAGGWVANPRSKTVSWEFLRLAYEVRDLVKNAAEKAYPKWERNFDMGLKDYNIKDEVVAK